MKRNTLAVAIAAISFGIATAAYGQSGGSGSGGGGSTTAADRCARTTGEERKRCLNSQPPGSAASGANGYSSTSPSSVGSASGGRP
jgi:hypothetical protein